MNLLKCDSQVFTRGQYFMSIYNKIKINANNSNTNLSPGNFLSIICLSIYISTTRLDKFISIQFSYHFVNIRRSTFTFHVYL